MSDQTLKRAIMILATAVAYLLASRLADRFVDSPKCAALATTERRAAQAASSLASPCLPRSSSGVPWAAARTRFPAAGTSVPICSINSCCVIMASMRTILICLDSGGRWSSSPPPSCSGATPAR